MANVTLFGQIIQTLDRAGFSKTVIKYQSDKHKKDGYFGLDRATDFGLNCAIFRF